MEVIAVLTREQIDSYEKQIDENYSKEKDAIKIMRRLLDSSERQLNGIVPIALAISQDSKPRCELPPLDLNLEAPTLNNKIEEALKAYPNEKWTMRRMLQYLKNAKFPLSPKPEGSISAVLGKFAKTGKLKVLRQGVGSVASIYQWNSDQPTTTPIESELFDEGGSVQISEDK